MNIFTENQSCTAAVVELPGLYHGPVQTPRCHQPSELCFLVLSLPQEQRDVSHSVSVLYYTKPDTSMSNTQVTRVIYCNTWYQSMTWDTPERIRAMPPQALGDDMDVPFISCVPRSVQFGTDAMAPPGALMLTPRAPSVLGPLDDQVYWLGGSFSLSEYSATIMSGVT